MKKINILWHSFELETNAANFLQAYLQKLDKVWENNWTDFETLDDIKYWLIEKLYSKHQPISQDDIFQITQEIGQPEEIFETKNFSSDNYIKNELASNRPLIWWVAYWISKSLKLNIFVVRLIFLILPFTLGILWILWGAPGMVMLSNFSTALYVILSLFVPYKARGQKSVFFSILEILLWIFRLFMVFVLAGIILSLIIFWIWLLMSKLYIVDNRSAELLFPSWFFVLAFVWTATLIIFALDFLLRFFNKRLFSPLATFSLLAVSFLSYALVWATLWKYMLDWTRNQVQIAGQTQDLWKIDDQNIIVSIPNNFSIFTNPSISFEATSWENILVEKNYNIYNLWNSKNLQNDLQELIVSKTWNRLIVGQEWYLGFKNIVPTNLLETNIKFLVPKNKTITIYENNSRNIFWRNYPLCYNGKMIYNESVQKFVCEENQNSDNSSIENQLTKKLQKEYNLESVELQNVWDDTYSFEWKSQDGKIITWTINWQDYLKYIPANISSSQPIIIHTSDEEIINNVIN